MAESQGRSSEVRRWNGVDDLGLLQPVLRCTAPDPRTFRAESRTVVSGGLVLTDWRSTELGGRSPHHAVDGALHLLVVRTGRVQYATDRGRWTAEPRTVHALRVGEDVRWTLARGSHVQRITLQPDHVPPHLRRTGAVPSGPVSSTKLTGAFTEALDHALTAGGDARVATLHVCRALQNIAVALLQQLAPAEEPGEADDLRERIVEHIDQHLSDQTLSPGTIADAFGVSLRWAHQSFNTGDVSLARYIRCRRVDAVAEQVREDRRPPRVGALAMRFGFSGRDQLARSFRARYGSTIGEYAQLVLDGQPVPLPQDGPCDRSEVA